MWRLKIAEGRGDPWLRTNNGHVGRQVWEFDAAAEPDPAVDAARRAFVERRHDLKHSADLLMRLQVRSRWSATTSNACRRWGRLRARAAAAGRACRRLDRPIGRAVSWRGRAPPRVRLEKAAVMALRMYSYYLADSRGVDGTGRIPQLPLAFNAGRMKRNLCSWDSR